MSRLVLLLCMVCAVAAPAIAESLDIISYDLRIQLFPSDERLTAECAVTLSNNSTQSISRIPVLLYRLLEVSDVLDASGHPVRFDQRVTRMADERSWQVTALSIYPAQPLAQGDTMRLTIKYHGYLYGYPEIMQYTRDRISEDYSLIRDDIFAYPMFSDTSNKSRMATFGDDFSYTTRVTAPAGYYVACGGQLVSTDTARDSVTFAYRSKVDVSRIDIAAAKFGVLSDSASQLSVFYMPGDSAGARHVMKAMQDVIPFYTERFGPAPGYAGFAVLEIPDGWGSQAGTFYIMQTAAAFKDSTRVSEVYHEVGHSWNARPALSVQRCRYFDEAFASYFESLAIGKFRGDSALAKDMESTRAWYVKSSERSPEGRTVPIAQYGEKELGGFSYTKGAWSLYVLHRLIGDDTFNALIRTMLAEYTDKPIDFASFQQLAERVSRRNLDKFFDEWIYTTVSSDLLVAGTGIDEIVARYK